MSSNAVFELMLYALVPESGQKTKERIKRINDKFDRRLR